MCGIAGHIGIEKRTNYQITSALSSMKQRGPNAYGHCHFSKHNQSVDLLHTRLSILDLDDRSNQPYFDEDHCLVFNGEIYNYIELKQQLKALGWDFYTSGDTEVLFKALKQWGKNALQRLNGMWAFAYYHLKSGTTWICRDRFGEKPLYLRQQDQELTFASEIKTIEALRSEKEEVNLTQIFRYVTLGYKSLYKKEDTFFKNISEVQKATLLEIQSDGRVSKECYWKPALSTKEMSYEDSVEGFREKLITSVRTRMRTDVPLAFCLSGGVDSASLASIAQKELNLNIQTYSIIDGDPRYNESDNILATINDLSCKNKLVYLNSEENHLGELQKLIQYHDSPVSTITYYIHSLLVKEISKNGIKVSISGTAADELVTGYYDHFLAFLCEMRDDSSYHEHLRAWKEHIFPTIRNPILKDPELYIKNKSYRNHLYFKQEEFSEYLVHDFHEEFAEQNYHDSLLRNRMLNELFHEVTPITLHEEDLNNMCYSIENRSPFLDHDLMEYAYSIPTRHLMRNGRAKTILRDSVKGILNDQVRLDRRKRGFNASLQTLIDFDSKDVQELILDNSRIYEFVKKDKIESAIKKNDSSNSFSKFLFYFLNSKLFLDQRL